MRDTDYFRIERAISYLESNFHDQPKLKDVAKSVNLSEHHFQRLFRRWAGISPKRFLQFLTIEYAKKCLEESKSVLDAAYESGLSGTGRLHDLFINVEAVTPGEFKARGTGLKIVYGFHPTPFGPCLLAVTDRGICGLSFLMGGSRSQAFQDLKGKWPGATFVQSQSATQLVFQRIFPRAKGKQRPAVNLFLKGTNFQLKVWEAMLKIPAGSIVSYDEVARYLGKSGAARAVGSAVGQNPIAYLIPCHRVIRKVGVIGDYHWGTARKKAMLGWEAARTQDGAGETLPTHAKANTR